MKNDAVNVARLFNENIFPKEHIPDAHEIGVALKNCRGSRRRNRSRRINSPGRIISADTEGSGVSVPSRWTRGETRKEPILQSPPSDPLAADSRCRPAGKSASLRCLGPNTLYPAGVPRKLGRRRRNRLARGPNGNELGISIVGLDAVAIADSAGKGRKYVSHPSPCAVAGPPLLPMKNRLTYGSPSRRQSSPEITA